MDRIEKWRRVFDALVGLEVTAGEVILHAVEAWLDRLPTAEIIIDAAGIVENVVAGGEVDETDGAQSVFGGKRADDQRSAADEPGVKDAAKTGNAVRQHHAVDAELHIGMIVTHVNEAACGRILAIRPASATRPSRPAHWRPAAAPQWSGA